MSEEKEKPINFDIALHNLTIALDAMITGVNNYKRKPNASQFAIEKQENNIIAIYQFIESTEWKVGGQQYGNDRIYSAAVFWKQTTFNAWKECEKWKEMYKDSIEKRIKLEEQINTLTIRNDG